METDPLKHLKDSSKLLAKEIENIRLNRDLDDITKSNKIMERLRGDTIFLPESYVNKRKENISKCTIDPKECLDLTLSKIEEGIGEDDSKTALIKQGIVAIHGNSLGPYYPEDYFKDTTFKVLWLLKESYIEWPSFNAGDRGGHNQAAEYAAYGVNGNDTHQNLVDYTRTILLTLGETDPNATDKDVMKHICIIEANHFPGLAFPNQSSEDGLIRKWLPVTKNVVSELIRWYNSDIVISGGDYMLNYLCNDSIFHWCGADTYQKIQTEAKYEECRPLKIGEQTVDYSWPLPPKTHHSILRTKKCNTCDDSIQTNGSFRYWINTYHPKQTKAEGQKILEDDIMNSAQYILNDRNCS